MQISLNEKETVDSTKNTNCVAATSHLQQYARVQEEKAKIEWKLQEIDVKHQHLAYEINRLSEVQRLFKINASVNLDRNIQFQYTQCQEQLRHLQQQANSLEEIRTQNVAAYVQLQNTYNILEASIKENLNHAITPPSEDDVCFILFPLFFIFISFIKESSPESDLNLSTLHNAPPYEPMNTISNQTSNVATPKRGTSNVMTNENKQTTSIQDNPFRQAYFSFILSHQHTWPEAHRPYVHNANDSLKKIQSEQPFQFNPKAMEFKPGFFDKLNPNPNPNPNPKPNPKPSSLDT
ncbi:hypothetical protein RFI_35470, partial [Reticulomyxa filosa]